MFVTVRTNKSSQISQILIHTTFSIELESIRKKYVPLTLRDDTIVEQMMPPDLLKHHSGSKTYEVGGL